jgi:hypothetical protein
MSPAAANTKSLRVEDEAGRLVIPVSSKLAESVQNHLRRVGIGSTLCLVPYSDEAKLEIWQGASAAAVQAALSATPA